MQQACDGEHYRIIAAICLRVAPRVFEVLVGGGFAGAGRLLRRVPSLVAAIATLQACRFTPGEKDGKPVAVRVRGFTIRCLMPSAR